MRQRTYIFAIAIGALLLALTVARADHRVGDICRIKGQEENTLHGIGLIVGLSGTGDGDMKNTMKALSRFMDLHGIRAGTTPTGQPNLDDLKGIKNVALVLVTAIVPPGGAQQGDNLDCTISAFGAKSLEGGYLMLTALRGPSPTDETIYALARGKVSLDDAARPQVGRVALGCQIEKRIENQFVKDGKLTLVINKDHAAFQTAAEVEMAINQQPDFSGSSTGQGIAKAIDQVSIEVTIPPNYADNPPLFVYRLLSDTRLTPPSVDTRVIIDERKQVIIVGADVEIGAVAVMHKNRLIQIGNEQLNQAVAFDPKGDLSKPKLASLVDALNELRVPTADVIDIIKLLKHKRALFGELIIE